MTLGSRYVDGPRLARFFLAAADWVAADSPDISVFMTRLLLEGELALARTPELLAVLKEAGVVVAAERDFQDCTEVMVRGEQLPAADEVRAQIRNFGGSVQVVFAADILRIHVHTDTPEAVFTFAARWGGIESTRAEDMRAQHRKLAHGNHRPVAVVADSSADLPDAVLDRRHIQLVPLQVMFGDETFRDRVELKPIEFYRKLRVSKAHPTTSQPTPGEFVRRRRLWSRSGAFGGRTPGSRPCWT